MSYIEKEPIVKKIEALETSPCDSRDDYYVGLVAAETIVRIAPAEDVIKVVRCKDCKYRVPTTNEKWKKEGLVHFCTIHRENFRELTDYCNYGRVKERWEL